MDDFFDNERIQKMIALGIYDEGKAQQLGQVKQGGQTSKATNRTDDTRPTAGPPLGRPVERPAVQKMPSRDTFDRPMRGGPRGGPRGNPRGGPRGRPLSTRGGGDWRGNTGTFNPMPNSRVKWQELDVPIDDKDFGPKRSRNAFEGTTDRTDTFSSTFRDGIRDGIQTKIQRNEIERKLTIDYMNDRNSGNSTDKRPVTDTDSRISDTDLRPNSNHRKPTQNLSNSFTAKDGDMRPHRGSGDRGGHISPPYKKPGSALVDDLDDFIKNCNMKMGQIGGMDRGKGRSSGPHNPQRPNSQKRFLEQRSGSMGPHSDDPLGLRQPEPYVRQPREEADIVEVRPEPEANSSKHIAILKETVEELAKSNLYCQYCDCYLSSLAEVNSHIGTVTHQQNMTTKEEQNLHNQQRETVSRVSQTIVEKVPIGIATIVQMIEQKKKITLKDLTDMDSYEINSDSEAALAKELAKLLTNELLNYKMNQMPEQVKEALKHQGIGLFNSMIRN